MDDAPAILPAWDETDLPALLTLDEHSPGRYTSRFGDANRNGRAYGGQVLGQSMAAACLSVESARAPTLLQFLFLQGTDPSRPIDFEVTVLQDGRRFSSRHVRGRQGETIVLDANASFALPLPAPQHAAASTATEAEPETLAALPDVPPDWEDGLRRLGGYSLQPKASIDFRVPDVAHQLGPASAQPRLRFWLKAKRALPDSPRLHAAAFAYLSDWWLNYASLGPHVRDLREDSRLYIASLNHTIWFHRPFAADRWLHFDAHSPCADAGRGLSIAQVHDQQGHLVATTTQECLMGYA